MSPVLAEALGIPPHRIIPPPVQELVRLVRTSPLHPETDNPAAKLIDFLSDSFEHTSCGGLILDTARSQEHSKTMANEGPVSADVARRFVAAWIKDGFSSWGLNFL